MLHGIACCQSQERYPVILTIVFLQFHYHRSYRHQQHGLGKYGKGLEVSLHLTVNNILFHQQLNVRLMHKPGTGACLVHKCPGQAVLFIIKSNL